MPDTYKPATSKKEFEKQTPLLVDFIAEMKLQDVEHSLTPEQQKWFVTHCDKYVRWLHANVPAWTAALNQGEKGRDLTHAFIDHWLKSYLLDPVTFQQRRPEELLEELPAV